MQIDWFTLVAQIVNFLILMYLLRRLLYGRILDIAEEREEQIASRYEEAQKRQERATAQREEYEEKVNELENKEEAWLAEAREKAREKRHELEEQARGEVAAEKSAWEESLAQEKASFLQSLSQQAGQQVTKTTRRVLADLADVELEARITAVFLDRLQNLEEAQYEKLQAAANGNALRVRSAFPLPDETRQQVREVLHSHLPVEGDVEVDFAQDDALICGIALRGNGRQVAWSIDSYLAELEERIRRQLEQQIGAPEQKAEEGEEEEETDEQ